MNPFDTVEDIRTLAEVENVSIQTVRHRLMEAGLMERRPAEKNDLTDARKEQRLKFAREHIHYDLDFWRKVIWSDEKTFSSDAHGPLWVRRLSDQRYEPVHLYRSITSTRKTVNTWGCIL